ncbi:hypothetical protein [Agromyces sp. NPDC049794]|uniref:hypothetical protein n=1 Tax=unclassified Agromyces TaxID=2639701 RepID=UPI0033FFF001
MTGERRRTLRRKYLSLGSGELAAAVVFAAVAIWFVAPRLSSPTDVAALWSALTPLFVVLVQAGVYWLGARSWVELEPMPAASAALLRVFRVADVALLAAGLAGVIVWWPESVGVALGVLAVWAFGVIEYVNYFVVRLAYPPGRWFTLVGVWRTPRLMQDVRTAAHKPS